MAVSSGSLVAWDLRQPRPGPALRDEASTASGETFMSLVPRPLWLVLSNHLNLICSHSFLLDFSLSLSSHICTGRTSDAALHCDRYDERRSVRVGSAARRLPDGHTKAAPARARLVPTLPSHSGRPPVVRRRGRSPATVGLQPTAAPACLLRGGERDGRHSAPAVPCATAFVRLPRGCLDARACVRKLGPENASSTLTLRRRQKKV
jgi:hypothetical protein